MQILGLICKILQIIPSTPSTPRNYGPALGNESAEFCMTSQFGDILEQFTIFIPLFFFLMILF